MFIVILKFTDKTKAPQFMDGHNAWLKQGFDEGVFLLAGSLQPGAGGVVLSHNISQTDLQVRVQQDPFVVAGVVSADILEITPGRIDERLAFLKE